LTVTDGGFDLGESLQNIFSLFSLCRCELVDSMHGSEELISSAIAKALQKGLCKSGSPVVVVHGSKEAAAGSTNLLRVMTA
jgi:pyruvate kinase